MLSIDFGDVIRRQDHPSAWPIPTLASHLPLPSLNSDTLTFQKSLFKRIRHLTLTSALANDPTKLSDLPPTLTSLIYLNRGSISAILPEGHLATDLPQLQSLVVSYLGAESFQVDSDGGISQFVRDLPRTLHTLSICLPCPLERLDLQGDALPPGLVSFSYFGYGHNMLHTSAYGPPPSIPREVFSIPLPPTITDLRLETYTLRNTDCGWGFDQLNSLLRLHLRGVASDAVSLLPLTLTHIELRGTEATPLSQHEWPKRLTTFRFRHHRSFDCNYPAILDKNAILPASVTCLIYERQHFSEAEQYLLMKSELQLLFGDANIGDAPFFARHLTSIELLRITIAESLLPRITECSQLKLIIVHDVTLCGLSIPPNTTELNNDQDFNGWFWKYWRNRLPLVLKSTTPLRFWTNALNSLLYRDRPESAPKMSLPEGITSITLKDHCFDFNRLPTSITNAQHVFAIGPFTKSLPNLTTLGLIWKRQEDLYIDEIASVAPKVTLVDGAWVTVHASFIIKNARKIHEMHKSGRKPTPEAKLTLEDYSMANVRGAGELESEYGGHVARPAQASIASSSAPSPSVSGEGSLETVSESNSPQPFKPDPQDMSDVLRIPGIFGRMFIQLSPIRFNNSSIYDRRVLRSLEEPLPVFNIFEFSGGDLSASDYFFESGIPHGVLEVDMLDARLMQMDETTVMMPKLPNSVTRLSFSGPYALNFLYGSITKGQPLGRDFNWIPDSITTMTVVHDAQDNVDWSMPNVAWTLPYLPPNLTSLTIKTPLKSITSASMKALPRHLSNITLSDNKDEMTATGKKSKKSGSDKRDKENCILS